METKASQVKKEIKKIEPLDYIFLGIIVVSITITAAIFFHSTSFIVKNINKIFLTSNEVTSQTLDTKKYELIEKKLNLPKNVPSDENTEETAELSKEIIETKSVNDKELLTIKIINTTAKDGLAKALSKDLESSGFAKSTTESQKVISSTVISIKESQKEYFELIKKIVEKSYPKISTTINPENSDYDVIIIIGK